MALISQFNEYVNKTNSCDALLLNPTSNTILNKLPGVRHVMAPGGINCAVLKLDWKFKCQLNPLISYLCTYKQNVCLLERYSM